MARAEVRSEKALVDKISSPEIRSKLAGAIPIKDRQPTIKDAAPPIPFSRATICGICIILTFFVITIPIIKAIPSDM